ncbi:ABC transporter permease [Acidisphaera sp. L21]|uniref:ABC transporter permease n=1 Tax=Acidisphaera sp. L21 TaxID=1641851 RepID=UPI00131AEB42|nr:ABC transporter permease [Acidisphaera sp. L21]
MSFILRRALLAIPSLFGLLVVTFLMIHVSPADPATTLAGDNATAEQIARIRHQYGLDQPLAVQFVRYVADVAQLDFGDSQYSSRPVATDLLGRLPATLELTLVALILATALGIPIGVVAAMHHNRWPDITLRLLSVAGVAVATFWLAIMLQMFFSMRLGWLPLRGRLTDGLAAPAGPTGLLLVDSLLHGDLTVFTDAFAHIVLPAATLALGGIATIARFTRAGVLDTMSRDFVQYARATGTPRQRLIWIYVLRNSVLAAVSQIGLLFGGLIAGSVVVESIFDWPGIGNYTVQAILTADSKVLLAVTLLIGVIYAVVNILTDLAQAAIDPRLRERR